jgi:hypothetical protein
VLSSAAGLMKLRAQAERGSGIGLKLFGFIAESVFTFIRNTVRVHPGTAFGIIPESRSRFPGFPKKGMSGRKAAEKNRRTVCPSTRTLTP